MLETSEQVGAAERRRRCRPAGFLRASNTCFTCFAFLLHHSPHFVLLGQLGEEVLVLQDVWVGVERGEGVEEERGKLCGHAGSGRLLSAFAFAMRLSSFFVVQGQLKSSLFVVQGQLKATW